MRVITLATLATMPRALVLARSLEAHEPRWPLEIVMVAGEEVVRSARDGHETPVRSASEELELDIETLLARFDDEDLTTLLLPQVLRRYARSAGEPVLHLPCTAWVLGELSVIREALTRRSVLLAPRISADPPDDGLEPSRLQLERAGRMDETIMAVTGTPAGEGFLGWWGRRVEEVLGSLDGREEGARPEDRPWLARWLELAPARFTTAVLDDPGCNLSMWSMHAHALRSTPEGVLVDGSFPLRFLNLPGFDPDRPHRLNAMASRARISRSPVLHELSERYAEELRRAGWRNSEHRRFVGRRLANGLVYDEALRAMHAAALALGEPFEDPFSEQGTRAFTSWLQAPAPRGGAYGIDRYIFHRVARERPDVIRTYPDIDGADGPEFLAWCRAYGAAELAIPERFMPVTRAGATRAGEQAGAERSPTGPRAAGGDEHAVAGDSQSAATDGLAAGAHGRSAARAAATGATSQPAAPAPTVRLTGYLGHTLGLGAAGRAYAQALEAAGVRVSTVSVPLHHLELPVALEEQYGRHSFEDTSQDAPPAFEIVAVNADELPGFVERLGEEYFHGPRIGIWGWETNTIPERWWQAFSLVDELWVYSRFMADNIGAVSPVPVIALPPPVQAPTASAPTRLGVTEGFLFLFVFDYLSTIQRKNPVGLIEAFKLAFEPGEGPQLLIKTINGPLRPLAEEELLWAAHGRPDVHLIDRSLDGAALAGLMSACDCYVSLHRAEGFGLTLAEAMAIGKPVIGTRYSGNLDFMNDENSFLVDYTIGRVGPDCEIYPPEGEWAEPDIEQAAALMRLVHSEPAQAAARGQRAREDIARQLSAEATGARMRERLEQLPGSGGRRAKLTAALG